MIHDRAGNIPGIPSGNGMQNSPVPAGTGAAGKKPGILPLTCLPPDHEYRVACIRGDGTVARRLTDLGLTPGTVIALRKRAPCGGPVEIAVRRTRIAVDCATAATIFCEPPEGGGP